MLETQVRSTRDQDIDGKRKSLPNGQEQNQEERTSYLQTGSDAKLPTPAT